MPKHFKCQYQVYLNTELYLGNYGNYGCRPECKQTSTSQKGEKGGKKYANLQSRKSMIINVASTYGSLLKYFYFKVTLCRTFKN